jgi:uncharacterized protein
MLRIVLLIAAILLLVWLLRGIGRGGRKEAPPAEGGGARRTGTKAAATMVACAHCGVHLPRSEAVQAQGLHFCGEPHRIEFERQQAPR